jgi:hypothetical protein
MNGFFDIFSKNLPVLASFGTIFALSLGDRGHSGFSGEI